MAPQRVAGDLYEGLTRQLFEIGSQLGYPNGYPYDPLRLKAHLQDAVEGRFPNRTFVSAFSGEMDMRKQGWTVIMDVGKVPLDFRGSKLAVVSFLDQREPSINGEEMRKRAREMGANLGQCHAEFLVRHQEQIPAEARRYRLVFPGTVWQDHVGNLCICCLDWHLSDSWSPTFCSLECQWRPSRRFLVPDRRLTRPSNS